METTCSSSLFCSGPEHQNVLILLRVWWSCTWQKAWIFKESFYLTLLDICINSCVIKANHLVYIVPRWCGSRIYADCQQKLFSLRHDSGARILLVTFLAEQKGEYTEFLVGLLRWPSWGLLSTFCFQWILDQKTLLNNVV